MKKSKTRLPTLADQFDLAEAFLASPDAAALKSALIRATDRSTGDPVLLKYWEKTGAPIDADLRALWRHEMRQVERVRAFPGADEVIVDILNYGEASDAFFVATSGEFAPLEFVAKRVKPDNWLRSLHIPRRRLILWENIRRLAIALGAMHDQGVVHGRLDQRAIFTTGGTQADFRIGGFEWCLRVTEAPLAPVGAIAANRSDPLVFSFLEDWKALGVLAISLFDISQSDLEQDQISGSNSQKNLVELKPSEIDLLRSLLNPERNQALDAEIVSSRIDGVDRELKLQSSTDNGRYVLALRLGDTSKLSSAIRVATSEAIETDDRAAQIAFVIADIQTGAQLCRGTRGHYLLTETLAYELQPLRQAGAEETWNVASCNMAKSRADLRLGRVVATEIPANRVEVIPFGAASQRLQELRSDALDWSAALVDPAPEDSTMPSVQRGLLLAQVAEALFRASEIIPVEITQDIREHGKHIIRLTADDQRSKLNVSLGIEDAASQIRRFFEREEADLDAEWQLSESGGLGSSGRGTAAVRFLRLRQRDNGLLYEFQSDGPAPPAKKLFLRKVDDSGTWRALQNRLRMLAALGTQQELSATLIEPRSRLRSYPEKPLERDNEFLKLDTSKQLALDSIWSTGPAQLVVGPPGVGKTTLVVELVRRILMAETGARLLVSAQAHQALDHLAGAVQKAIAGTDLSGKSLLVRSRSNKAAKLEGAQTQDRAKHYLAALDSSPLVQMAPLAIRRAVNDMRQSAQKDNQRNTPADRERRSFEALILQSANVLFSTTNSGDLARLVDERTQFDWVIVEEAAKATGSELLAPQLLSMRRVLIGDHNQLPPFDTDRIIKFLEDQTRVRTALAECDAAVGAVFRDHGLDELRDALADDATLSATCETARRTLLLFEALVNQELDRQVRSNPRRRVATELLEQHRMHPVIGELISECFYSSRLLTPQSCRDRFANTSPPFSIANSAIPASPIVFVNMPYVQKAPGAAEEAPNYHNPAEVSAVISVLSALRAGTSRERASLAVLSGYKQQVDRLGRAIEDGLDGPLQGLSGFVKPSNMQGFAGTVDSFQGNEADIVVLSLVRNNDHVGGHALGFLRDRRRMNVFLSRAKWQMVIVGSLDFLRVQGRRYSRARGGDPAASAFLSTLVGALDRLQATELANGTPAAAVIDWLSLARGP